MTPVVFAVPYTPPPPPGTPWPGLTMTWTGWDGSVWTLTNDEGGVYLPREGVRGLGAAKTELYLQEAPGVAGARVTGSRALARDVHWSVEVWSDQGSLAWLERDTAFWNTLDPDRPGTWRVTRPDGQWRELDLLFVDDDDHAPDVDPSVLGWDVYSVNFVAPQPYWRSKPIVGGPWKVATTDPFVPPTGGPPLTIAGAVAGSEELTNPGHVDVMLTWNLTGVDAGTTVGVGGHSIPIDIDVPEGSTLVIDTDNQVALLDGVDVSDAVNLGNAAPIPAMTTAQLEVAIVGTGTVTAMFVPLWRRAW